MKVFDKIVIAINHVTWEIINSLTNLLITRLDIHWGDHEKTSYFTLQRVKFDNHLRVSNPTVVVKYTKTGGS